MDERRLHDLTPVAVCIPAHGDPEALARTLASVDRAHHREDAAVIVAIDGPDSHLEQVARALADVVVVLPASAGSYAARNAALGQLTPTCRAVLFTDSDATVDAGWIESHLAALQCAPRSGGPVEFAFSADPTPAEIVDARRHLDQRFYVEHLAYAATANLAVRREVIDAVRFDDILRSGGDFDFGQRCLRAGYPIVFTPGAVVRHPARASARALLAKVDRVARGASILAGAGHAATRRHRPRSALRDVARRAGVDPSPLWLARAAAIDAGCSVAFARHNPSVVLPAVRRRLGRAR